MFGVEIVLPRGDDENNSLRVLAMVIIHHIENQGSFLGYCYHRLEAIDQQNVVNHITKYVLALLISLQFVTVELDGANCASEKDAPPVMLV
jgi:hypothetical protein